MKRVVVGSLCLSCVFAVAAWSQPGGGKDGPPRFQLGDLFPPKVKQMLNLTEEQTRQIAAIEADVKVRLEKILSAEQKAILDRPPPKKDGKDNANDNGRPVEDVARELGVTPDQFREAFKKVQPAPAGEEPTHEQRVRNRKVLSDALGVSPERLDQVMDKYRPGGKGTNGPPQR